MQNLEPVTPKDIFLVITRDKNVFDPTSPAGVFIADIASVVPELHIVYVGNKQRQTEKINKNTWVYTAEYIPFFSFYNVYQVIRSELVWKGHFRPTAIISIGDEIKISSKFAKRYHRPLYAFHSYMKLLGKTGITLSSLVRACPQKIFVPNAYIGKAIEEHSDYKSKDTTIKVIPEYIDIPELSRLFEEDPSREINERNKIFTIITFPHKANFQTFSMIKKISSEVLASIAKFQFSMVVKSNQYLKACFLRYIYGLPIAILKEDKDSIKLFKTSRVMIYFDKSESPYEPILYSFITGCPVLSSGDVYSKIILFNSGFEEFANLSRKGATFGFNIKKLINDPYLYTKYKMNCIGFAKTAFTNYRENYVALLRDGLNASV